MEWLKELLGDAYTEDIDAGVRQYIGRNFVSKSDFRAKAEEVRNLTAELDRTAAATCKRSWTNCRRNTMQT